MALLPRKTFGSGMGVGLPGSGVVDSTFGSGGCPMGLGMTGIGIDLGIAPEGAGKGAGDGTGRGLVLSAGLDGVFTAARFLGDFGS